MRSEEVQTTLPTLSLSATTTSSYQTVSNRLETMLFARGAPLVIIMVRFHRDCNRVSGTLDLKIRGTFLTFLYFLDSSAANIRLREVIEDYLDEYQRAKSKMGRSAIVSKIIGTVQGETGKFVRQDAKTSKWFHVGSRTAREKVGQAIRAAIRKRGEQHQLQPARAKSQNQNVSADAGQASVHSEGAHTPISAHRAVTERVQSFDSLSRAGSGGAAVSSSTDPQEGSQLRGEGERLSSRRKFDTIRSPSLTASNPYSLPFRPHSFLPRTSPAPDSPCGNEAHDPRYAFVEGISHERRLLRGTSSETGNERIIDPSLAVSSGFGAYEPIPLDLFRSDIPARPWTYPPYMCEVRESNALAQTGPPRGSLFSGAFENLDRTGTSSDHQHDRPSWQRNLKHSPNGGVAYGNPVSRMLGMERERPATENPLNLGGNHRSTAVSHLLSREASSTQNLAAAGGQGSPPEVPAPSGRLVSKRGRK